jgi:Lon protease-like protein
VGVRLQLTEAEQHDDGTFSILAVGRDRISLERLDSSGLFPLGHVEERPEAVPVMDPMLEAVMERARSTFTAYRAALAAIRADPHEGSLPQDPTYLSWTLSASAPLPMPERQGLLECDDPISRLEMVTDLLRAELRAMNVIPSLPATEVARTRWSPN